MFISGMMGGMGMGGGMPAPMGMSTSRPGSRPPTRPGSAMGEPTLPIEWAIPQTKRVAYSAQFQVKELWYNPLTNFFVSKFQIL